VTHATRNLRRWGKLALGTRSTALRSLTVCVAAVVLGGTAGCGTVTLTGAPASRVAPVAGPWTTRAVDRGQVSLSVPLNWNAGEPWLSPNSFTDLVASFSNQPLSPPCMTGPMSLTCGPPLTSLGSGAVLVEVFQNAFPGWTIDSQRGSPTMVSGLQARVGAQGACDGLRADAEHTIVVALSTPSNYIEITICSRGADDAVATRILASVRVTEIG
jgi:hypothetical protein